MTKKDYTLIAAGLLHAKPFGTSYEVRREQWARDGRSIATALQAGNPRFDRDKFLAACGISERSGQVYKSEQGRWVDRD